MTKEAKEFWDSIIYKDGKMDEEQVLKELGDYYIMLQTVPEVYHYITGGLLTKPLTEPFHIKSTCDEMYKKIYNEYINDFLDFAVEDEIIDKSQYRRLQKHLDRFI